MPGPAARSPRTRTTRKVTGVLGDASSDSRGLARVIAGVPTAIAICDPETSRFVWVNHAMGRMLGRDPAQLLTLTRAEVSDPTHLPEEERLAGEMSRGERSTYRLRTAYLRPDGELVPADVTVTSHRAPEGDELSRLVVASPVTPDERLVSLLRLLADAPDSQTLGHAVAHRMLHRHRVLFVSVCRHEPESGKLRRVVSYGAVPGERMAPATQSMQVSVPETAVLQEGVAISASVRSLRERFPLVSGWAVADPDRLDAHAFVLPLWSRGVVVGAMSVVMAEPPDPVWQVRWELDDVSSLVAAWLLTQPAGDAGDAGEAASEGAALRLTERQQQILTLVAQRRSNEQIARAIGFSEGTVRADLRRLTRLLGASGRVDLVGRARRAGLLGPPP